MSRHALCSPCLLGQSMQESASAGVQLCCALASFYKSVSFSSFQLFRHNISIHAIASSVLSNSLRSGSLFEIVYGAATSQRYCIVAVWVVSDSLSTAISHPDLVAKIIVHPLVCGRRPGLYVLRQSAPTRAIVGRDLARL